MAGEGWGASPKARARTIGALYLLTVLLGGLVQAFVSDRLVVVGDAAGTAANIVANEGLYRLGLTLYLVEMASQVAMTTLFYGLLRPVSKSLALLAMVFGLFGCAIKTVSRIFYAAPLFVLGGAHYLSPFDPQELEALASLVLRLNYQGETIAMVFFGLGAIVTGYLVFRSTFLPRALGALSMCGGLGWLSYLSPSLGDRLIVIVLPVAILGAFSMIGWLLVVGVNEQRWKELAGAARNHIQI
jgi:hypothetical protein